MRIFIHRANIVDNNKQSKPNKIETVTAETKNTRSSIKMSIRTWPIVRLIKLNRSTLDNTSQVQYFFVIQFRWWRCWYVYLCLSLHRFLLPSTLLFQYYSAQISGSNHMAKILGLAPCTVLTVDFSLAVYFSYCITLYNVSQKTSTFYFSNNSVKN